MKNLPVINFEEIERQELRERINLDRRPALSFTAQQLDGVSTKLAASNYDREQFVNDPRAYLAQHRIPVPTSRLVTTSPPQTSEACTVSIESTICIFTVAIMFNTLFTTSRCFTDTTGCWPQNPDNSYLYSPQSPTQFGFVGVL